MCGAIHPSSPGVVCATPSTLPHADHFSDGIIWDNEQFVWTAVPPAQRPSAPTMKDLAGLVNESKQGADDAMGGALLAAGEEWERYATSIVLRLAEKGEPFSADEVWEKTPPERRPSEPRALGAIMAGCARAGAIVKIGTRTSVRRSGITSEWIGVRPKTLMEVFALDAEAHLHELTGD